MWLNDTKVIKNDQLKKKYDKTEFKKKIIKIIINVQTKKRNSEKQS